MSVEAASHVMTGFNLLEDDVISGTYSSYTNAMSATDRASFVAFLKKVQRLGMTLYYRVDISNASTSSSAVGVGGIRLMYGSTSLRHINPNATFTLDGVDLDLVTSVTVYGINPSGTATTLSNVCFNLSWDGERDGEYAPYQEYAYPLGDVTLRGIPKLDASNNLYYDGDEYESDGTVTRRYGAITFGVDYTNKPGVWFAADENKNSWAFYYNLAYLPTAFAVDSAISDRFVCKGPNNSVYSSGVPYEFALYEQSTTRYISFRIPKSAVGTPADASDLGDKIQAWVAANPFTVLAPLATPTTESSDPYQNPQIVDDFGTEEYVDRGATASTPTRDVAIPVGHETTYQANLRAKLEMAPDSPDGDGDYIVRQTNGLNEYVTLTKELPTAPTTEGTYHLKATVASGGAVTLTWEADT